MALAMLKMRAGCKLHGNSYKSSFLPSWPPTECLWLLHFLNCCFLYICTSLRLRVGQKSCHDNHWRCKWLAYSRGCCITKKKAPAWQTTYCVEDKGILQFTNKRMGRLFGRS